MTTKLFMSVQRCKKEVYNNIPCGYYNELWTETKLFLDTRIHLSSEIYFLVFLRWIYNKNYEQSLDRLATLFTCPRP